MDNVNHPEHYNQFKFEAIDVIEDWQLNFNLGCVVKYIARADFKGNKKQDLEKALWYLTRELERINGLEEPIYPTDEFKVKDWKSLKRFFKENTPLCVTFAICILIVLVAFIVK